MDEIGRAIDAQRKRKEELHAEVARLEEALDWASTETAQKALSAQLKQKRAALSLAEDFGD